MNNTKMDQLGCVLYIYRYLIIIIEEAKNLRSWGKTQEDPEGKEGGRYVNTVLVYEILIN